MTPLPLAEIASTAFLAPVLLVLWLRVGACEKRMGQLVDRIDHLIDKQQDTHNA